MNDPKLVAANLLTACAIGLGLGLVYGFLRPLRKQSAAFADLLFVLCVFTAWLYLAFGVCHGDLRLGYGAGLAVGAIVWECTAGKLLRPVFRGFWHSVFRVLGFPARFLKKILQKGNIFAKKCFSSAEKWSTIMCGKRCGKQQNKGGRRNGKHSDIARTLVLH